MQHAQLSRRTLLNLGTQSLLGSALARGVVAGSTGLGRYAAFRFGVKALVPLGLVVIPPTEAEAEPFTIFAVLVGGILLGSAASEAKALEERKAWMARQPSRGDDFHDSNGARNVVRPEYRGIATLDNGLVLDTRRQGRVSLVGRGNADGVGRKDLSEDELALIQHQPGVKNTAQPSLSAILLPRSDRVAEVPKNDRASQLQAEAWQAMFGAQPTKTSYTREFADAAGRRRYLVSRHQEADSGVTQFYVNGVPS